MKKRIGITTIVLLLVGGVRAQEATQTTIDSDAPVELTPEQKMALLQAQTKRISQTVEACTKQAACMEDVRCLARKIVETADSIDPAPITLKDLATSAVLPWFLIACYAVHYLTS